MKPTKLILPIILLCVVSLVYFNKLVIFHDGIKNYKDIEIYAAGKKIWSGDIDLNDMRIIMFSAHAGDQYELRSSKGTKFFQDKPGYVSPAYSGIDKLTIFSFEKIRWD